MTKHNHDHHGRCADRRQPELPDRRPARPAAAAGLPADREARAPEPRAHSRARGSRQGLGGLRHADRSPTTSPATPRPRSSRRSASRRKSFLRFSTVAGERGAADAERDVRGFALKFYTDEGNWDLVGNNTPVFFVRDPVKFPDFIHTQKRHPAHEPALARPPCGISGRSAPRACTRSRS